MAITKKALLDMASRNMTTIEAAAKLLVSWQAISKMAKQFDISFVDMPISASSSKSRLAPRPSRRQTSKPSVPAPATERIVATPARTKIDAKSMAMLAPRKANLKRDPRKNVLVPEILSYKRRNNPNFLSREEERELIAAWQSKRDIAALERLMRKYDPLLRAHAAKKAADVWMSDIRGDLYGEAKIAFMHAIDLFDLSNGAALGWFAQFHIAGAINQFIRDQSRNIRLVTNTRNKQIVRDVLDLFIENGTRDISNEDIVRIAAKTDAKHVRVAAIAHFLQTGDVHLDHDRSYLVVKQETGSVLPVCEQSSLPAARLQKREEHRLAHRIIDKVSGELDPLQKSILVDRIMATDKPLSFDRLALRHGTDRRRVAKAEKHLMTKLRAAASRLGVTSLDLVADPEISVFSDLMV